MSYSQSYFTARETWRDWHIEARELTRLARVTRGVRVLEIGCGGGGLLRMLLEHGADAVGVDTLETALQLAQKNLDADSREERRKENHTPPLTPSLSPLGRGRKVPSPFRERVRVRVNNLRPSASIRVPLIHIGENATLPFHIASFDAILGQHVVEHLPDVSAALCEWHRLLKPNGRLAFATPNALYPDPAHFADADHVHIFSSRELCDAVERAGFVVHECFTIFPFLSRLRPLLAMGVMAYNLFRRAPYFAERGRTIVISASKK